MIVLDTHVWLWATANPERLSAPAKGAIDRADRVGVAAISCWEVAMLALRGRIALDREPERWVRQALSRPGIEAIPLMPHAAVAAALLDEQGFAGDPADRLIYATARDAGATLVTKDRRLRDFDTRATLW